MKWIKSILPVAILLVSVSVSPAWAHGRQMNHSPRWGIGLVINPFPLFYSPYYSAPYYPYPSRYYPEVIVDTVIMPARNTVYVQQSNSISFSPYPAVSVTPESGVSGGDWYYCHHPDGFYPSIKTCPSGWQRVPAQAPTDR